MYFRCFTVTKARYTRICLCKHRARRQEKRRNILRQHICYESALLKVAIMSIVTVSCNMAEGYTFIASYRFDRGKHTWLTTDINLEHEKTWTCPGPVFLVKFFPFPPFSFGIFLIFFFLHFVFRHVKQVCVQVARPRINCFPCGTAGEYGICLRWNTVTAGV